MYYKGSIIKRLVIYLLCLTLFLQSGLGAYAEENDVVQDQLQIDEVSTENQMEVPQTEGDSFQDEVINQDEIGDSTVEMNEEVSGETGILNEENVLDEEKEGVNKGQIKVEEENITESIEENTEFIDDDPQYGRENGYIDESFFDGEIFLDERSEYVHNDRFSNHEIRDVIDVSKYQGTIDWNRVKRSGIDYAMIRVGFRGYGQSGTLNLDTNFQKNIEGALKAGIQVGVYIFSQAITEQEAVEEAEYVLARVADYDISLPVVIDFEYASSGSGLTGRLYNAHLSKNEATKICRAFCRTVENKGYQGMVYANKDMLENNLNASEIAKDYQIWLAHYTSETSYTGEYDFWQYTQSGKVDGISGNVDKSFWYQPKEEAYVEVEEGIYTISTCLDQNKKVDIPSSSLINGTSIITYKSSGNWNQRFYIRPESQDTYVIMSANSGKVLELNEKKEIFQNSYSGQDTQQWRFKIDSNGNYIIESVAFNKVMTVLDKEGKNGSVIIADEYVGKTWQKFKLNLEQIDTVQNGIYNIETSLQFDKMLKIHEDGIKCELSKVQVDNKYKFEIRSTNKGCYKIYSTYNQKTLLAGNNELIMFGDNSEEDLNQKWIVRECKSNEYVILSAYDGKCLSITTENTVIKSENNGNTSQKFKLYEIYEGEEILEDGIYTIHSALDEKKVLDVCRASKNSDANIALYDSCGYDWQKFIIKRMQDGTYSIKGLHSGMSMDINGNNVYQYFPVERESQKWKIIPVGKGCYSIVNVSTGKVLDVSGGKAKNGANIIVYESHGTNNQKFTFDKVGEISDSDSLYTGIADGTYVICSSLDESKVLDVSRGSLYAGSNICLYKSGNTSNQQFIFQKDVKTGLYTITSKKSGMKVSYLNGQEKNGVNVLQDCIGGNAESQWKLKHVVGDYYLIYAGNSDYCLDVTGAKTANGTNIEIYQAHKGKAQIFKLKKISNQVATEQNVDVQVKEGMYMIATALDNSMVLDVASSSQKDGANIILYKKSTGNNQKFVVQKLENGNYTIKALCSDKLLTVSGNNVCQKTDQGQSEQQWKIYYVGNGYFTLESAENGKVMDLAQGKSANGTNVGVYQSRYYAWQRFKFIPTSSAATAKFMADGNNGYNVNYQVYTNDKISSADNKFYLMQADCYTEKIYGSPLASVEKKFDVTFNLNISDRRKLKEIAMNKLVLAVKNSNGTYKAVASAVSISNLELIAQNKAPIFKASSKKGLQGVAYASNGNQPVDARYTNTKQTLLNLDLASVVNPRSDYTNFTYKGKTYQFSNCTALKANIRSMNAGYEQYLYGNNGTTKVSVSLCLLLGYNSANSYLIDPAAREQGHSYYLMNVREQKARDTLEAAFVYLSEIFGQEDCYVTNWILGNEINSSRAWNYAGNLDFDSYMNCYTTAFSMLYRAVKSEKTGNTVSISLDNGWTAAPDTYAGKTVLDTFAKKIHAEGPEIEWSIAYHAYSYPLTRVDFWNDHSNTSNSSSTRYISMNNITVLTNYAASLEKTYKKRSGSIRVLLTEQGYSYSGGSDNQAMAIARGYYLAEFNNRIDAFIIRSIVDDREEAIGQLYFGLMNSQQEKRTAFYVYEYMDSDLSKFSKTSAQGTVSSANYSKFNSAKRIVCNTNWKAIVPGFNASKLAGIK